MRLRRRVAPDRQEAVPARSGHRRTAELPAVAGPHLPEVRGVAPIAVPLAATGPVPLLTGAVTRALAATVTGTGTVTGALVRLTSAVFPTRRRLGPGSSIG
ncbi:hypothetical protein I3F58_13715 [Streptomyces sp. MUM 203J]|uniref:hypothetical protein n=1 Tax=Streptomyces sp. MUM 203J TaxID=2791990 RepID=UPI001F034CF3|nr:hypothetical protein [Streptomyces sp. MUM 203J]MCH0540609.1 hypothetical protein [Streptomyces sp. MUM 203J]